MMNDMKILNIRIINLLFISVILSVLGSCTPEVDSVFDDSSANRITKALQVDKEILQGAKNGWLMKYYPASDQRYGGYNMLVKFGTDGNAVIACDKFDASKTSTSNYSLVQSAGPVLTFNEYNEIIHYFSDPVNSDGIGKKGEGMLGDFEFTLREVSNQKIVMYGKKTNSRIEMTPISPDTNWTNYLKSIQVAEYNMGFGMYSYVAGNITAKVTMSYRSMTMNYADEKGNNISTNIPYLVTPTGYELYDTLSIGNVKVKTLTYNAGNHEFVSDGTGGAKLYGIITPLNQLLTGGSNWYFSYGNLSTFGQPYWDKAANDLYTKEGEVLSYMYLNANIIYFKSGSYPGKYTMTSSLQGDNNIGFKLSGYDSNGQFYYTNGYFQYFLYPFCGASGRSFTLSCDNIQNPTVIILTDVTDSSNVITLTKKSSAPY